MRLQAIKKKTTGMKAFICPMPAVTGTAMLTSRWVCMLWGEKLEGPKYVTKQFLVPWFSGNPFKFTMVKS